MVGDGYSVVRHCETLDLIHSDHEPDAHPVVCQAQNANVRSTLDESAWRVVCEAVATQAHQGCGLSYGLYMDRFSSAIDIQVERLPGDQRAQALFIAKQEWDYATPAERQAAQDWNADNGFCTHGIELGCCPAGCGS
jgi:DsbC/DsbD-like thiol-disulfide interchange protein